MEELTDKMIENALENTVYMGNENTTIIIIMIVAALIGGTVFFLSKSIRQKIGFGGTALLFVLMGFGIIHNNNSMARPIKDGEWEVETDIVERVMESTDDDGDNNYFMVLEEYGRVSLADRTEANQYYKGQEVYVIVVPTNNGYESVGVTFPTDTYSYIGEH